MGWSNKASIEIEANTVEEAISKALRELGINRKQADIEILCDEEKGLFGMPGAKQAKVRVSHRSKKAQS